MTAPRVLPRRTLLPPCAQTGGARSTGACLANGDGGCPYCRQLAPTVRQATATTRMGRA